MCVVLCSTLQKEGVWADTRLPSAGACKAVLNARVVQSCTGVDGMWLLFPWLPVVTCCITPEVVQSSVIPSGKLCSEASSFCSSIETPVCVIVPRARAGIV